MSESITKKTEEQEEQIDMAAIPFLQRVAMLQSEMKVPKNLYNSHGNYFYRNAETIMESAKKICPKYGMILKVEDFIEVYEGWHYIKSVATLVDFCTLDVLEWSAQGFARETESRKGMDSSQVTGATSSYSRKYALNALFLLDDNKDPDTEEFQTADEPKDEPRQALDQATLAVKLTSVSNELTGIGVDIHEEEFVKYVCTKADVKSIDPGKLLMDLNAMDRVIKVMEAIVKAKKK